MQNTRSTTVGNGLPQPQIKIIVDIILGNNNDPKKRALYPQDDKATIIDYKLYSIIQKTSYGGMKSLAEKARQLIKETVGHKGTLSSRNKTEILSQLKASTENIPLQ